MAKSVPTTSLSMVLGMPITGSPELCNLLVRELDEPIISTSVPFGENGFMVDPEDLLLEFRNKIDLIIDSGPMARRPSTIVDLTEKIPRILREGAGDISLLE